MNKDNRDSKFEKSAPNSKNKIDFTDNSEQKEKGFTTGSAAAGAAKAATFMLLRQKPVSTIEIATPATIILKLAIADFQVSKKQAEAVIVKKAGDDPDVTDGMKIGARVEFLPESAGIKIAAGSGVGTVTKPGLAVDEGEPAINPVPREMIRSEVEKAVEEVTAGENGSDISDDNCGGNSTSGFKVTIFAPGGEKIAEETFNPDLGIVGGISILGTSGIVEPMSDKAYRDSMALKLSQARAQGWKNIVLVFGNYGREKARELGFSEEQIIRMSNYVGFMLEKCCQEEVEEVLVIGQIGKLVKVAAGIFNTHSKIADARLETIAAHSAAIGAETTAVQKILAANTTEDAVKMILENDLQRVFPVLVDNILERIKTYTDCEFKAGAVLFSLNSGVLAAAGNTNLLAERKGLHNYERN